MPTITLNKREFERLVGKKLQLEKLKDRISYLGTDLEDIKTNEINLEIFPNRPDLLSEQGFARAFSSFIGVKTGLRKYSVKKSNHKVIIHSSLKDIRPYTACAIVKNLKLDDEKIKQIIQIQEKLHITYGRNRKKIAIGIYPFEKIKTPIYFKAEDPSKIKFQPLEYPTELTGSQILSKHKAGREFGHLLENYKKYPIFIDSNNNILSMPPIINSELTGKITQKTKDVFIECSGFDLRILQKCLNMIVTALADMSGIIYSMELKYENKTITTPNLTPEKINLDLNYVNKILGLSLTEKQIKKYLERMGYDYKNKTVLIPAYRTDILHQIDLIEDIAIAYGYENFKQEIPKVATIASESKMEILKNKIAEILMGLNLTEVSTYALSNNHIQNTFMNTSLSLIHLKNSVSSDYNVLRMWLTPSLLEVLKNNKHNEYPQNIFEISTIFKTGTSETHTQENERLCILLHDKNTNFTVIKQILDYLFSSLNLKYSINETEHPSFIPGRVARISHNNKEIAYIGEIHPSVLKNFGLELPVAALELNLTELFN